MNPIPEAIACQQLVELVTEYLEDALSEIERRLFEEHISICGNCREYLRQFRETISAAAALPAEPPAPDLKQQLMRLYREMLRP
jgi:hypothetical protein